MGCRIAPTRRIRLIPGCASSLCNAPTTSEGVCATKAPQAPTPSLQQQERALDFTVNNLLPFVLQALHIAPQAADMIEALWRAIAGNGPAHQTAHLVVNIALAQTRANGQSAQPPAT